MVNHTDQKLGTVNLNFIVWRSCAVNNTLLRDS